MDIDCHAYFDDSGDRGTRASSTDHLILGGFIASVSDEAEILGALAQARAEFKFPPNHVFHFHKLNHEKRLRLAEIIGGLPLTAQLTVLCKRGVGRTSPIHADQIFNWLMKLVMERCSWYCRDSGRKTSLTVEHSKGYHKKKMKNYVNRLRTMPTEVKWANLLTPIRFGSKRTHELLQIADAIASAGGYAFEPRFGLTEQHYLQLLAPRLWRRYGTLDAYGLKIHPARRGGCTTDHSWISGL